MSNDDNTLAPLKRFRLAAVRITLALTAVMAVAAYFWDPVAAHGVALGGIAGILGFWIIAVRLEKLVHTRPSKVQFAALTWSAYRFALYGIVLYRAYTLDRETYHGLIGALAGIMAIRFVLVFVGATGLDLGKRQAAESAVESGDDGHDENDG